LRRTACLSLTLSLTVLLAACEGMAGGTNDVSFPKAERPVAPIVSSRWSNEESRDRLNEADKVMNMAGIKSGMTVADIGAGEGYYTIRLSSRVGKGGRVLAQDIVPEVRDALAERVEREELRNVSVKLGAPDNPKLPANSFDRILLIHMYHEIGSPYAFLWHLRPALAKGGQVIVVDADRSTAEHGTPPALLQCEFSAVGYRMVSFQRTAFAGGYFAAFESVGKAPAPSAIKACSMADPPRPTATN
jgi:ubiquinone/menaquinone biosynthesis C-methylase UbiE